MRKIIFYSCILLLTGCVNEIGSTIEPKKEDSIKILSSSIVDTVEPGVKYIYSYMIYGNAESRGTVTLLGIYHIGDLVEGDFGQGTEVLRITSERTKLKVLPTK